MHKPNNTQTKKQWIPPNCMPFHGMQKQYEKYKSTIGQGLYVLVLVGRYHVGYSLTKEGPH